MAEEQSFTFGRYTLDRANARLRRDRKEIRLTKKAFDVLCYLVEHSDNLVTKETLLEKFWPEQHVSEAALAVQVGEIRKALGDNRKKPRFIETVHRRGYRFIGQRHITTPPPRPGQVQRTGYQPLFVGRNAELRYLHERFEKALHGQRQVIFVTGEMGIGKTTLIDAFVTQVMAQGAVWIGHGQCIKPYGAGEAYRPVLEALGRLGRQPGGEHFLNLLGRHAPSWLIQLSTLLSIAEREALQQRSMGATQERMLRELTEAVEALTVETPLVFVLEDLHWSDYSTLDLLSALARRHEAARLLLIGSYRPVEAIVLEHPLRTLTQELMLHKQCEEWALDYLSEKAVAEYLAVRLAGSPVPRDLASLVYQRTDGNPLFLVTIVDAMLKEGVLIEHNGRWELSREDTASNMEFPPTLRLLVEEQLRQVSPEERKVLEAASVEGVECAAAAIAAGIEQVEDDVEEICEHFVRRRQFLKVSEEFAWPDGTVGRLYGFIHALYQEVIYEQVPPGRQARLHQRIGARMEAGYGAQAREIAAELAAHFEHGQDYWRTVQYRLHAAENALHCCAHQEAVMHLTKGLDVLRRLALTPERVQQELRLQTKLGEVLMATKGYAAPDVGQTYARAYELCQQVGGTPQQRFPVLMGLLGFHLLRAELRTAQVLGAQCVQLAEPVQHPALLIQAYFVFGMTLLWLGDLMAARAQLEQGMALPALKERRTPLFRAVQDPLVGCQSYGAWALWLLGYPDQALRRSHEAITRAQELSHPFSEAFAFFFASVLHYLRREVQTTGERAEKAMTLCHEQGFALYLGQAMITRGWALVGQGREKEGIGLMRQGLAAQQKTGADLGLPDFLTLLAEAYGTMGQVDAGLAAVDEALIRVHNTEERFYEAEMYRLRGELLLRGSKSVKINGYHSQTSDAETCFQQAIAIACHQQAKSLELRAAMSLSRLWQQQGKRTDARALLAPIYGWFTEGFDTADLQEAKALFEELSQ